MPLKMEETICHGVLLIFPSGKNYLPFFRGFSFYAVQWEGIRLAQQAGCDEYDMFGTAPNPNSSHPLYGLYRFKSGFGGEMYHRMGCWDYPLNAEQYRAFRAQEVNFQGYHN